MLVWSPTPDGYREPTVFAAVPRRFASAMSLWWWRTARIASMLGACAVFVVNVVAGYQVGITQYPAFIAF